MGKLVPKLRFKEFSGEWEEKKLGDITSKISDGIHSTPNYKEDGEYYFINGNNLTNGIISINSNTKRVTKEEYEKHKRDLNGNTILLSINGTIGNIAIYKNEKIVLGKSACYINIEDNIVDKFFIIYSLKTNKIQNFFNTELTGSTIKNLSLKTIKNTFIYIPPDIDKEKKEQQKIASTLSSLDNLIEAYKQKVEALQKHKKGLMQQLFPADGEKVPKLRFKEFSGEWEEKKLGDICINISSGKTKALKNGNYNVYGSTGIIGKTEAFTHQGNYILIARVGANAGLINYVTGKFAVTDNTLILDINKNKIFMEFLKQLLYKINLNKLVFGSGQPLITGKQLKILKLMLPPDKEKKEQQKIASTLSSLDHLIEKTKQKVEALQKHKKGLMQQMFVSGEG